MKSFVGIRETGRNTTNNDTMTKRITVTFSDEELSRINSVIAEYAKLTNNFMPYSTYVTTVVKAWTRQEIKNIEQLKKQGETEDENNNNN